MKVGLIGFGRLGKLIGGYLAQDCDLLTYDENQELVPEMQKVGATSSELAAVCSCPIVILAVPISAIEACANSIKSLLRPDALVVDTCSVKTIPLKILQETLPPTISLLGTHPMFGPDSAAKTLYGSKIVLCPVKVEDQVLKDISSYLEVHGLKVIHSTPERHDQEISHSLLLTHLIGKVLINMKAKPLEIDTKGYRRLIKILEVVENDSTQLFIDMNQYNPYSKELRKEFKSSLSNVLSPFQL